MNNYVIYHLCAVKMKCMHGSKAQGKIRRRAQIHWKKTLHVNQRFATDFCPVAYTKEPVLYTLCSVPIGTQCNDYQWGFCAERVISTAQTVTDCQCVVLWSHKYLEIKTFQRSNISKQKHQNNGILRWVH